jgi:ligand-binding sensor domain-containing protein
MYRYLLLILWLITACTQPGKVSFPYEQNLHLPPKVVKATPTTHPIPDSLLQVQFVWKNGKLVLRDKQASLKPPKVTPVQGKLKTVNSGLQTFKLSHDLYIWNAKEKKLLKREPNKPLTSPKSFPVGTPKITPAKGKVVIANLPKVTILRQAIIKDKDAYGILSLGLDEGLPSTEISCFEKDKHGRIWLGTSNGLVVFEGNKVKIYTSKQGLLGNDIHCMAIDGDKVWAGTSMGLSCLENGKFTQYSKASGLDDNDVFSLAIDGKKLWIGTFKGLKLLENNTFTHYNKTNGLSDPTIRKLVVDGKKLWIGTVKGLNLFENNRFTHYTTANGLSRDKVWSLIKDGNKIWVGTESGLNLLQNGKFTHYTKQDGLSGNTIRSILADGDKIWVGTRKAGLNLIENGQVTHFNIDNGLASNYIVSLLKVNDQLWVGAKNGGVNFLNKGQFTHYTTENGLPNEFILSLLKEDKKLWVGTLGGGLACLENNTFTHYTTQNGLTENSVWSLAKHEGKLWMSTNKGVNVLGNNQITQYNSQSGLSVGIAGFFAKENNRLWFGNYGGGLTRIENNQFSQYTKQSGLINNAVSAILQGKEKLWIGTVDGMASLENGKFTHYNQKSGLSNNYVQCFLEEENGRLWIGTVEGLNCLENGRFTHYTIENGMTDNNINQLAIDQHNQIWAGSAHGLTQLNPKKGGGYTLKKWGKAQGFKYVGFNGLGNPMLFDGQGKLWTSIGQGLTAFQPPALDTTAPRIFISAVDINQQSIKWQKISSFKTSADTLYTSTNDTLLTSRLPADTSWLAKAGIVWDGTKGITSSLIPKNLVLPYDQNHLTFHYSGLQYGEQEDMVYKYILEGSDHQWSPFTKEGKVSYRNIAPGNYTFKVRAQTRNQIWSKEASFTFRVTPPWWQAWWAYILYGLAGLVLVYALLIWRTRNLKAKQKKLEGIVNQRTSELQVANMNLVNQKEEIATQNEELRQSQEELEAQRDYIEIRNKQLTQKNTLINQSIKVALSIQQSFLPSEQLFNDSFSEHFILFRPRDVVSGDFYWLHHTENATWLAVADCTGHGVPGAFMTMLGKSLLDRLIDVKKIDNPAEVLQKLDEEVIETLRQQETNNNAGMDIILLKIIQDNSPRVLYAGAKNSLYVVEKDNSILEYKADRMSIGGVNKKMVSYKNHQVTINNGSQLFLTTDGYQDQNDLNRKSFSRKKITQLFQEINSLPSPKQRQQLLAQTLDKHMKDTEQRDDILVIGVKI